MCLVVFVLFVAAFGFQVFLPAGPLCQLPSWVAPHFPSLFLPALFVWEVVPSFSLLECPQAATPTPVPRSHFDQGTLLSQVALTEAPPPVLTKGR